MAVLQKKRPAGPGRPPVYKGEGLTIVRAAHIIVACKVLRQVGVPVERELRRSGLPGLLEELPNEYVSMHAGLDWAMRCCKDLSPGDLGFLSANLSSLSTFDETLQQAILDAPSGVARIEAFRRLAAVENCRLQVQPKQEGEHLRVTCDIVQGEWHPGYIASEWLQVQALISLVRSVAGQGWTPREITFVSRDAPSFESQAAFPNTRILCGQPHTSVLLPADLLARPCRRRLVAANDDNYGVVPDRDFVAMLRLLVRPHLGEGNPGLEWAAGITGLTVRSLQRKLAEHGTTWSGLVTEARYQLACELLADESYKIVDVAMAAGYEHPQHFARAFRTVAGVSPRAYRAGLRRDR